MEEKVDLILTAGSVITCKPGAKPRRGPLMKELGVLSPGAVAIRNGIIVEVSAPQEIEKRYKCSSDRKMEFPDSCVLPGLIDAHTHPVFAGSRIDEYILRAKGATYLDIHKKGGGILSTVRATRAAKDEELIARLKSSLNRMLIHGTTTAEAKSGYGLNTEEELRQLRILRDVQKEHCVELVITFLGAHTIPEEYKNNRDGFVDLVINEMIPIISREKLAEFVDVFCEEGAFSVEESRKILSVARKYGLGLKIHAEQFTSSGSAVMAQELGATSCDHLLKIDKYQIEKMKSRETIAVFMPGTELFLGIQEYGPACEMIEAGIPVAIGTDYNAGSCLSESMPMAMSLAVLKMKLEPEEAIISGTVNAAHSVKRGSIVGSLEKEKQADLIVLDIKDYREWLYHFGVNMVKMVIKRGRVVYEGGTVKIPTSSV